MDILSKFSLANKVVLLTGGASLYGRGLAGDLAGAGATLVIASRDLEAGRKVAEEECRLGREVIAEQYDQGDEGSIEALCERLMQKFGRIDGLVNNAVSRPMTAHDGPIEEWDASLRVNATGIMLMHRIFGLPMCARGGGSIVNVSSIQGVVGPTLSLYADTPHPIPTPDYFFHKAGMLNLSRYYAALYGKQNIRVNCVSPGGFLSSQDPAFLEKYNSQTFLNRMGGPGDLGGAVVFLLSDASSYITGANLPVDGGYTAH